MITIKEKYRWLVTGGAGFIGSHVVEQLRALDQDIMVLDNFSTGSRKHIADHISLWSADVCSKRSVECAVEDVDYIIHLAALSDVRQSENCPLEYYQCNVTGFNNVLQGAMANPVRRVVYASSAAVYRSHCVDPWTENDVIHPNSIYGRTKATNEFTAEAYRQHVQCVGLRYFNVYGPRQKSNVIAKWLEDKRHGEAVEMFGYHTRDYVHVKDVVSATILAAVAPLESRHEIINIGTGKGTDLPTLSRMMNCFAITTGAGSSQSVADITKARTLLGWEPTITLEQGLKTL